MRPRRNHIYMQDQNEPTIYREFHVQERLVNTGRIFDLLRTFTEEQRAERMDYHKQQNEMLLVDMVDESAILLKYRGNDEDL